MARSAGAWCPGGRAGTKTGDRWVRAASMATRPAPAAMRASSQEVGPA